MDEKKIPQLEVEQKNDDFKRLSEYAIRMGIVKPEEKSEGGTDL